MEIRVNDVVTLRNEKKMRVLEMPPNSNELVCRPFKLDGTPSLRRKVIAREDVAIVHPRLY